MDYLAAVGRQVAGDDGWSEAGLAVVAGAETSPCNSRHNSKTSPIERMLPWRTCRRIHCQELHTVDCRQRAAVWDKGKVGEERARGSAAMAVVVVSVAGVMAMPTAAVATAAQVDLLAGLVVEWVV